MSTKDVQRKSMVTNDAKTFYLLGLMAKGTTCSFTLVREHSRELEISYVSSSWSVSLSHNMTCDVCLWHNMTCDVCLWHNMTCDVCLWHNMTCHVCLWHNMACHTCLSYNMTCHVWLWHNMACHICLYAISGTFHRCNISFFIIRKKLTNINQS